MNRENLARLFMAILWITVFILPNAPKAVWAQGTGTGSGSASIVVPLTLAPVNPLAFGSFSPGASGGSITVFPDGITPPAVSGTVVIMTSPPNSQGRGTIHVIGENGRSYAASGDDFVTLNCKFGCLPSSGAQSATADLQYWSESTGNLGTTSTTGNLAPHPGGFIGDVMGVSGALTVPADMVAGSWEGSFAVSANYN